MDRVALNIWVEIQLAPVLTKREIVILDNLAVHKSEGGGCAQEKGAWSLFLPQSPELNPD